MRKDLRIASPCSADWNRMVGDDRIRRCAECNLNVYNFAAMTSAEVEEIISNREGRLCARLYQRYDGTILTKDCPIGFQVKIRRISRVAGIAFAASTVNMNVAMAQIAPAPIPPNLCKFRKKKQELPYRLKIKLGLGYQRPEFLLKIWQERNILG